MRSPLLLAFTLFIIANSSARAQGEFGFDNRKPSGQPYLKPEETVAKMKVADGFEVKLFAAEPDVVNPIAMTVDEKGRVWVIECFEYPKRTAKGKMPRDRIVILEDTDGDGVCDKRVVFAEGKDFPVPFDLASGLEVGNGGVYVGAPPYLFFIENKNDKPGKFEILLKGFGSQDTHETLNTFQWGPDGWLYGLHGVFTHSEVKKEQADGPGTRLNAGVWRYEPKSKRFEIFAEGTSNPWGMDWRNTDGQFILCCCVIPHLYHMVPGGNYKRQAGQSFNPYAYGEIKEICDHTFHKESGWAHAGLISLDTPLMPEKYRNSVIFGSIHGCSIKQNILKPNGSSYIASRGEDFLVSGDKNFRPINLRWGPNGEIYCIDWHDQNPCHQAGADSWDYERGRVYRLQPEGLKTKKAEDLGKLSPDDLFDTMLKNPNPYLYRTALRLVTEKKPRILPYDPTSFRQILAVNAIASKWSDLLKYQELESGALGTVIRIGSQYPNDADDVVVALAEIGRTSRSVIIRRELASSAIHFGEKHDISPLLRNLLTRKEDSKDPIIPQLLWVAYEKQLFKSPSKELDWLKDNAAGNALVTETIIPRTMRRLMATGKKEDLSVCVTFVGALKDLAVKRAALQGLTIALENRIVDGPDEWKAVYASLKEDKDPEIVRLAGKLALNFRDVEAVKKALAIAGDSNKAISERAEAIKALALTRPPEALPILAKLAKPDAATELRIEAIRAFAAFDDPSIPKQLLADWSKLSPSLKNEVVGVLAGRKEWARALMAAVGDKTIARTELTDNTILRMQAFNDPQINTLIERHWGRVRNTPAELNVLINKMRGQLYEAPASFAKGKQVFTQHCAKCHKFDGAGAEVGPNIEGAGRDIEYLLVNVLDPNRVIGAPYFMRTVALLNGRNEQGVLQAEDDQSITLKTENAVLKTFAKKDVESIRVQEKSLMPEGLSGTMSVQDFRDLVRYVMANPFLTDVELTVQGRPDFKNAPTRPVIGVPGRISIAEDGEATIRAKLTAPDAMKTRLLVGIRADFTLELNGKTIAKVKGSAVAALPDQVSVAVELAKGENVVVIRFDAKKGDAVYARFLDPDRKLRYPEAPEKK
jgi:putative membrane-bound dehydrogenase-like protein